MVHIFELIPVAFWQYESTVLNRIISVEARWNSSESSKALVANTEDELIERFRAAGFKCEKDNKIVFECLTVSGSKVYIGFYDNVMSIGLGMTTAYWNLEAARKAWCPARPGKQAY